jgi:HlyD family secretion protein
VIRRRWPLLVLLLLAAGAAAWFLLPRSRAVDGVLVVRGPLAQTVVATGRVATPARIEISSQLAARIERILVREGDRVGAGQLLVQLRSEEAEASLAAARAALAEAQGRLVQLASVQRPLADQALAQAQANLKLAEQEAQRSRDLLARGYIAQARVDDAERALANARAALLAARAQAEATADGGIEGRLAAHRLEQARANVASAQARLELLALRAPADAVVLTRQAEPGDTAQIGRSLLTLAQNGETRIFATVDEKNLRYLRTGLAASAVADAFPGERFEASVYYVAPAVDASRGTVEVRLVVPKPPAFLRPDMTVSVEMVVGRREDALILASEAVRAADTDAPRVLVLRDGRAVSQPVTLGLRGVGTVEVTGGLKADEVVILPTSAVDPGERARLRGKPAARGGMQPVPGFTN